MLLQEGHLEVTGSVVYIFRIIHCEFHHNRLSSLELLLRGSNSLPSFSVQSPRDLLLGLTHAHGNLNKSRGDGLIGSELHKLRGHGNAEFLSHAGHLVEVWLGTECRGKSVQRLLSIHKSLKLGGWVVVRDAGLVLSLLLGSLLVSISNSCVHLSLHLGSLKSGLLDRQLLVSQLGLEHEESWIGVDIWVRGRLGHSWSSVREDSLGPGISSPQVRPEISLKLLSHVRSGLSLNSDLEINLVIYRVESKGFGTCKECKHNEIGSHELILYNHIKVCFLTSIT